VLARRFALCALWRYLYQMKIKLIILAVLVSASACAAAEMPSQLRGSWCFEDTYASRCNKSAQMVITRHKIDGCRVNYVLSRGSLWRVDCREGKRMGAYLFDLQGDRFQVYDWSENYAIRQEVIRGLGD
jgi:hypothetical protein